MRVKLPLHFLLAPRTLVACPQSLALAILRPAIKTQAQNTGGKSMALNTMTPSLEKPTLPCF